MTVSQYLTELNKTVSTLYHACPCSKEYLSCSKCPMQKAEGKACPVLQVMDVQRCLKYAIERGIHGITEDTPLDDAMVVLFIKRAVVRDYSVYTLRSCDESYIKFRNLLPIPREDVAPSVSGATYAES